LGAGALIATSQLPLLAKDGRTPFSPEDNRDVFPKRGKNERLSLSYATVEIGLEHPFSVLHFSDSHLTAAYASENAKKQELHESRTMTFGGMQEEALEETLLWAKQHTEFIVHTGDLIDWQSEANFDLVKKFFGETYIGCMGNHEYSPDMWLSEPREDGTEAYKDLSKEKLQEVYPFDIRFYAQQAHGVNFIALDDAYGVVTEDQVARFEEEVKRGLPIVLCVHVPIYTDNLWRSTKRYWSAKSRELDKELTIDGGYSVQQNDRVTRAFIKRLKDEPLLKCILAGHEHITVEDQFSPTCREYLVAGGFAFHAREVMFI